MRQLVLAAAFAVLLGSVAWASAGDPPVVPDDPRFVELAFRGALNAWAYSEYWRLYAMGTRDSRATLSEQDFVLEMEKGFRKPGIGVEIVDVHIRGAHAVIRAKVRMEYGRSPRERLGTRLLPTAPTDEVIQSVLVYEEDAWRINLYQFVGMARY